MIVFRLSLENVYMVTRRYGYGYLQTMIKRRRYGYDYLQTMWIRRSQTANTSGNEWGPFGKSNQGASIKVIPTRGVREGPPQWEHWGGVKVDNGVPFKY